MSEIRCLTKIVFLFLKSISIYYKNFNQIMFGAHLTILDLFHQKVPNLESRSRPKEICLEKNYEIHDDQQDQVDHEGVFCNNIC